MGEREVRMKPADFALWLNNSRLSFAFSVLKDVEREK
jgi:hypothetical protein